MEERDYSALRGLIRAKMGSEQKFAQAIGRSSTFVSQVFNGKAEFNSSDIWATKELFELEESEIGDLFFSKKDDKLATH